MEGLRRNSTRIRNSKDDFNPDSRGKSVTVSQIQESVNYGEFILPETYSCRMKLSRWRSQPNLGQLRGKDAKGAQFIGLGMG